MRMSTLLTLIGDETELRFVAENVPEGISAKDHAEGTDSSLEKFARFVEDTHSPHAPTFPRT